MANSRIAWDLWCWNRWYEPARIFIRDSGKAKDFADRFSKSPLETDDVIREIVAREHAALKQHDEEKKS